MRRLTWLLAVALAACVGVAADRGLRTVDPMASVVFLETHTGHGSGFFVAPGEVVTNRHVACPDMEGPCPRTKLVTARGESGLEYQIVGHRVHPERDLAVLEVVPATGRPLNLDCRFPVRGERVRALGHPGPVRFGEYRGRVASSLTALDMAALDLGIGRGISGGPLLDSDDDVVGVATAAVDDRGTMSHTGLAEPASQLCEFLSRP